MATTDRRLVVTTHSRLRSARFFPAMMLASWQIRRQLARTDGVVRWASVVAGPTEFWTVTVWRNRHAMQEFMRSDAHGHIMWLISRWLASFWLMRWRPGTGERGSWAGLALAGAEVGAGAGTDCPAGPAPASATGAETAVRIRQDVLDEALQTIPHLRAAIGPDGTAAYDNTPFVRRWREQVAGAGGVAIRIGVPWHRMGVAVAALTRLRRQLRPDPDLLRAVVGVGRPGEVWLLTVWSDHAGSERLLGSPWARAAERRWGDGYWAGTWLPENEFGHWDGLRLRKNRQATVPQPPAGPGAAGSSGPTP